MGPGLLQACLEFSARSRAASVPSARGSGCRLPVVPLQGSAKRRPGPDPRSHGRPLPRGRVCRGCRPRVFLVASLRASSSPAASSSAPDRVSACADFPKPSRGGAKTPPPEGPVGRPGWFWFSLLAPPRNRGEPHSRGPLQKRGGLLPGRGGAPRKELSACGTSAHACAHHHPRPLPPIPLPPSPRSSP